MVSCYKQPKYCFGIPKGCKMTLKGKKSSTSRISSTHTNSIYYKDLDQRETSSLVH